MNKMIRYAAVALLLIASEAGAQNGTGNRYETAEGFYLLGSLVLSETNYHHTDTEVGFGFGGGYRFNEWIAAEGDFYWAGSHHQRTRVWGMTINAKAYPLGWYSPDTLDFIQPYLVVGMGGGRHKSKRVGLPNEGTFIFRLGAGVEWLFAENLGAIFDVSLHATPGFSHGGHGGATGVFQFGLAYHF